MHKMTAPELIFKLDIKYFVNICLKVNYKLIDYLDGKSINMKRKDWSICCMMQQDLFGLRNLFGLNAWGVWLKGSTCAYINVKEMFPGLKLVSDRLILGKFPTVA